MGLLTDHVVVTEKKTTDEALLIHGIMLMASVSGEMGEGEIATLEGVFHSLPEFKDVDFDKVFVEAKKIAAKFYTTKSAVEILSEIQNPAVKLKCFIIAADVAMSGKVVKEEDELLSEMQRVLGVEDEKAKTILTTLGWKYAR